MKLIVDYMSGPIHVETTLNADVVPSVGEFISLDTEKRFLVVKSVVHMFMDHAKQTILIKAEFETPAK